MKSKSAIKKLLANGYEVSSFARLMIKPKQDGTYLVINGEIFDTPNGKAIHDPKEETFDSRRKAIRYFLKRRRELLPQLETAAVAADETNSAKKKRTATPKRTRTKK